MGLNPYIVFIVLVAVLIGAVIFVVKMLQRGHRKHIQQKEHASDKSEAALFI